MKTIRRESVKTKVFLYLLSNALIVKRNSTSLNELLKEINDPKKIKMIPRQRED